MPHPPTAAQTPAPAPARRRGRPGHDRDAVLRTAIELFIAQGYDATSISDLASSLGVTKSAVYHHFPSKLALFESVFDRLQEKATREIEKRIDRYTANAHSEPVPMAAE